MIAHDLAAQSLDRDLGKRTATRTDFKPLRLRQGETSLRDDRFAYTDFSLAPL